MLDPRSILFILAILSLLMAIVLSALPSALRDRRQGAGHWSGGIACVAVAALLHGLRDIAPPLLSLSIANAIAIGATVLIYSGGRAFFGQPAHTKKLLAAWLLSSLALAYCYHVYDLYAVRVVIFSGVSGVLLLLFSLDTLRHRPRDSERAAFPYLFTALTVMFDSVISLTRIINALLNPSMDGNILAPTLINALYFSTHGLLAICISVGFILMLNERLNAMLMHQLSHDSLTNAYSRSMICELAERELASARQPISLLMLDIDHFKRVNDTFGHQGGDEVLKHFVRVIGGQLRTHEPLGRYGGEEFVVLLRNADEKTARMIAERLRQAMANTPYYGVQPALAITTSIGVATARPNERLQQLLQRADDALYRAKHAGRNRVEQA